MCNLWASASTRAIEMRDKGPLEPHRKKIVEHVGRAENNARGFHGRLGSLSEHRAVVRKEPGEREARHQENTKKGLLPLVLGGKD